MREELEKKLSEEFPFLLRGTSLAEQMANGGIHDLYSAFGCENGDGWYDVLRGLCAEISAAYKKAGEPIDIIVDQVKEKWGTLRFYYHQEGHEPVFHAIDFMGKGGLRVKPDNSELLQEISEIVSKWEDKSETVCEKCGAQGTLRTNLGRVQTLCDACCIDETERNQRGRRVMNSFISSTQ